MHACVYEGILRQYFCILAGSKKEIKLLHWNYLQFLQTIPGDLLPELPFTSGTCVWWSCFADKASAPFEPCTRECVSHAKWRTVVVYGQSNIVLGCLCCTWWYGANRGICQMQSGVMEGRDTARWNREQGREKGEGTAWAAPGSLWSISCEGTKTKPDTHTYTHALITSWNHRWDHFWVTPFCVASGL